MSAKTSPSDELATGEFVRRNENVTFVGKSGLGKTHIIEGLGKRCCVAGYRVLYTKSGQLIEVLNKARAIKSLPQQVRKIRAFDLLVIECPTLSSRACSHPKLLIIRKP